MTHRLWINGRIAWPLVMTVVLLALGLVGADFLWRELTIPFETLAIIFLVTVIGVVVAAVVLPRFLRLPNRR